MDSHLLEGKVALVTGSSRGIGASIVSLFAREGAKVVINGLDAQAMARVKFQIEDHGGLAMQVVADVTRYDEIEAMRNMIEAEFGPVDILVANVGRNLVMPGPVETIDEAAWGATVDANLTATFLTIKSFLPGMKERQTGNIITISSAAARRPNEHSPIPYAAAKAGIQILTQDVAAQAGPFGVRVNCISPETILTENNLQRIPEETQQAMLKMHLIKRLGTPEDVAHAALFLASDQSAWITGVILDVAGGSVML